MTQNTETEHCWIKQIGNSMVLEGLQFSSFILSGDATENHNKVEMQKNMKNITSIKRKSCTVVH